MMAAEIGFAAAQFNVAYLCEQNMVSYRNLHIENIHVFIITVISLIR